MYHDLATMNITDSQPRTQSLKMFIVCMDYQDSTGYRKHLSTNPCFVYNIEALIPWALPLGFVLLYCIQTLGSWLITDFFVHLNIIIPQTIELLT